MTAQDKALKENTASAPLQIVAPGTCVETGEQAALVLGMYDHLVETIHQYNPSADFAQIDKAFRYADTHHNGQLRKDGSPFITHPLAVAQIIAEELRLDSESIEAALKEYGNRTELDAAMVDALIDEVVLFNDGHYEVKLKYRDEMEELLLNAALWQKEAQRYA